MGTIAVGEDSALLAVSEWGECERTSGAFRVYKVLRAFGRRMRVGKPWRRLGGSERALRGIDAWGLG